MNLIDIIQKRYFEIYEVECSQKDIIKLLYSFGKVQIYTYTIDNFCKWLWNNN
jgi:hypothetical protein